MSQVLLEVKVEKGPLKDYLVLTSQTGLTLLRLDPFFSLGFIFLKVHLYLHKTS